MKLDVVLLNRKIILTPEFGDQPKMIKKIKLFSWVECCIHLFKNLISYFDNQNKTFFFLLMQWVIWVTLYLYKFLIMAPTNYVN